MKGCPLLKGLFFAALLSTGLASGGVLARDAAFVEPGAVGVGKTANNDAIIVEPKSDIDLGDTMINAARRVVLFFVNQSNVPVGLSDVTVNGDASVTSSIISDDCSKENTLAAGNRCSVVVSISPSNVGPWSVEVMMTHKGAGRIARAKISGKVSGSSAGSDRKDTGLSMNSKEPTPINFGEIEVGARAVRSALMINDSPDPITLFAIDLIAPENGLERLNQGCVVDMDLKPGESCPITVVWKPTSRSLVSTDMIIRHSGKMGFAVIPIRGTTPKGDVGKSSKDANAGSFSNATKGNTATLMPPTADELEKAAASSIPQVSDKALGGGSAASISGASSVASSVSGVTSATFHLIGTVGERAILVTPDGEQIIAGVGETIKYGEGQTAKILMVSSKKAALYAAGKRKELTLETLQEITSKGVSSHYEGLSSSSSSSSSSSKSSARSVSGGK